MIKKDPIKKKKIFLARHSGSRKGLVPLLSSAPAGRRRRAARVEKKKRNMQKKSEEEEEENDQHSLGGGLPSERPFHFSYTLHHPLSPNPSSLIRKVEPGGSISRVGGKLGVRQKKVFFCL